MTALDWSETRSAPPPLSPAFPAPAADAAGLGTIERGAARVSVDEKRMINCRADVNQLLPLKYRWAWEKYLAGCNNHWMPTEVSMQAEGVENHARPTQEPRYRREGRGQLGSGRRITGGRDHRVRG